MAGMILYLFVIAFISVPLAMIAKYLVQLKRTYAGWQIE
jgi:hypothetical protein